MAQPEGPTERRFERPHRPVGLRLANRAGWFVARVRPGVLSLDRDDLVETARRRSGLHDLDLAEASPTSYVEALDALLGSLEHQAALTPAGRYFAREQVVTSLSNRLALNAALAADPDVRNRSLSPALVIVGLPRSGTTFLQHLLARDPAHRVLRHWEAAHPAAERGPSQDQAAQRATDRSLRLLDYLAPDARALHPVDTGEPTECVTLFSNSLASLELATINQVPGYLAWCLANDLSGAYREYELQLKVLESHECRPRWLLKSPAHLFWLNQLLEVLPHARIIQIHRDPLEVLGSFCSLSAVLSGIGSDHVDLAAIGARWAGAWADGLARAEVARMRWPSDRFVDLEYSSLVRDPMHEVRRIYERFDLELRGDAHSLMTAFIASHPQHAGGVHRYSLSQFGLDPDLEADRFVRFRPDPSS
jgi:hypothetical protein